MSERPRRRPSPDRRSPDRRSPERAGPERAGRTRSGSERAGRTRSGSDRAGRPRPGSGTPAGSGSGGTPARSAPRPAGPTLPEGVDWTQLDQDSRRDLRSLPKELAERVGAHLVAAGQLLPDDPAEAYRHAKEARRLASRVPVVREAAGLAAYAVGDWAEALAELRAYRRMTGDERHLPLMADCERGLGRPERALDLVRSPQLLRLDSSGRLEARLVEAGARRDLGQLDAALLLLEQTPGLSGPATTPALVRTRYAYADALVAAGRPEEARAWFATVAAVDPDGVTDAAERLLELDGVRFADVEDAAVPPEPPDAPR